MKKQFIMLGFWICALAVTIAYARLAYGELMKDNPTDDNIGICGNHCWYDLRGKNLKEWKYEDHIYPEVKKVERVAAVNKPIVGHDKVSPPKKEQKFEKATVTLGGDVKIVACLNEKDMTIHEPNSGTCFLGKGGRWKNIMLPPQSHIDQFKKIFGDDYKYRLAIANFEGSFREDAKNTYAIGYLQTLRSHKVKPDIVSQLSWLKNREDKNTGVACNTYLTENFTLFGTMNIEAGKLAKYTCMARRHYGAFNPGEGKHYDHSVMYAKRYKVTTNYYLSLNF